MVWSKLSSLLTRRSSEPSVAATDEKQYTVASQSPVLVSRASLSALGTRIANKLTAVAPSASFASSSPAQSLQVDPLNPLFALNSLQSFAERAEQRAVRVARKQAALDSAVVALNVACAARVSEFAALLQRVHFLQVNAAVVDSLQREASAALRSVELLCSQTALLERELDLVSSSSSSSSLLLPRAPMWTQYESVRSLYSNSNDDNYRTWAELIPTWSASKGVVWVRQLWTRGVPPDFRATVWCDAIGNDLMLTRSEYASLCALIDAKLVGERAARAEHQAEYRRVVASEALARETGTAVLAVPASPAATAVDAVASELRMVSVDVPRTFGELKIFGDGSATAPAHELNAAACALRRVVLAASLRPGSPGYCQGMTHIAAMLLLYMDEFDAYVCLVNLIERHFFHSLFAMDLDQLNRHLALYDALFAARLPDVYAHLRALGVRTSAYALDWFMTLFGKALEHRCCARVFDVFMLEGETFLFRVAIAILSLQRRRLLNAEIEHVSRILKDTPFLDEALLFGTIDESVAPAPDVADAVERIEAADRDRRRRLRHDAALASINVH